MRPGRLLASALSLLQPKPPLTEVPQVLDPQVLVEATLEQNPSLTGVAQAPPALLKGTLEHTDGALEMIAFSDAISDADEAAAAFDAKRAWQPTVDATIEQLAPFYRSEGYVVCLEGLEDASGYPLVLSNGMAHGDRLEVKQQVAYAHERCIERCIGLGRPTVRATTIVNVRNPTFRYPDNALRAAIEMVDRYYPWAAASKTIFVGFPSPVRHVFQGALLATRPSDFSGPRRHCTDATPDRTDAV